jgi:Arc/MetJ family transcription regulator
MRTTVTLDEKLLKAASAAIGTTERSVVLREALQALIERDAARRLARLGGSDPRAGISPRRRSTPARAGRRATS